MQEINYIAILGTTIVATMLGMLWFGKVMFGNYWMKFMGHVDKNGKQITSDEEMKRLEKGMGSTYALQFIVNVIMFSVLFIIITATKNQNAISPYFITFILWLGFVMPIEAISNLWSNLPHRAWKWQKFFISSLYQLVVMLIATFIFLM